jgi:acyl-CoA hydrolase
MEKKTPKDSYTVMTQMVLPNDTNGLYNLRGGKSLHWMDLATAIVAQKHSGRVAVTASVDNVSFRHPIKVGDVVTIEAKITRAFKTSMEVKAEVWAENIPNRRKVKSNEAYFTFVALNDLGEPELVPEIEPETEQEQEDFEKALRRRDLRLILAGKKQPGDSEELKKLFQ